jgi:hypothetical protein
VARKLCGDQRGLVSRLRAGRGLLNRTAVTVREAGFRGQGRYAGPHSIMRSVPRILLSLVHPRGIEGGLVPCANCGQPLSPNASLCPRCRYPWPLAYDENIVRCPTCGQGTSVYVPIRYRGGKVHWEKAARCGHCGERKPWRGAVIRARRSPVPVRRLAVIILALVVLFLMYFFPIYR